MGYLREQEVQKGMRIIRIIVSVVNVPDRWQEAQSCAASMPSPQIATCSMLDGIPATDVDLKNDGS
jgi:hypothetical protein